MTFHDEDGLLHPERIEQPPNHFVSSILHSSKAPANVHCKNLGLSGRLKRGAGVRIFNNLNSQELSFKLSHVSHEAVHQWLLSEPDPQTETVLPNVIKHVGTKSLGHSNPILSVAYGGELLVTKDEKPMRLWRAKDATLLRVISGCPGDTVSFSPSRQKIVTGYIYKKSRIKLWGPAGGNVVCCGKTKITAGKDYPILSMPV